MKTIPNLKNFASVFLVLIGMHVALFEYLPEKYQQYEIFYAHGGLFLFALILDFILNKVKKIDDKQIGKAFVGFSTFKMIAGIIFLIPWIGSDDAYQFPFIIEFFVVYFLYLGTEAMIFIRFYLSKV